VYHRHASSIKTRGFCADEEQSKQNLWIQGMYDLKLSRVGYTAKGSRVISAITENLTFDVSETVAASFIRD
jgi:hypothetical protein